MLSDNSKYFDLSQYRRVLNVAETPTSDEFVNVLKISMAGLSVLGLLGFLMYVVVFLLPGGV